MSASSWYHPPSLLQCSFFLHRSLSSASPAIPRSAACGSPTAPLTPMRVCECVRVYGRLISCHKELATNLLLCLVELSVSLLLLLKGCFLSSECLHTSAHQETGQVTVNSPSSQFTHSLIKSQSIPPCLSLPTHWSSCRNFSARVSNISLMRLR